MEKNNTTDKTAATEAAQRKRFRVEVSRTVWSTVYVEAESKEDAEDLAGRVDMEDIWGWDGSRARWGDIEVDSLEECGDGEGETSDIVETDDDSPRAIGPFEVWLSLDETIRVSDLLESGSRQGIDTCRNKDHQA